MTVVSTPSRLTRTFLVKPGSTLLLAESSEAPLQFLTLLAARATR
jgi:hypothetical protein